MGNVQLVCDGTPGLFAAFTLRATDSGGVNDYPASGNGTIDNYSAAFLVAGGGQNSFQILPKITMSPGAATITVNATFNLVDGASGIALPPYTVSVDLVAPPEPSQKATQVIVVPPGPVGGAGSDLTDPGSAQIPVSLT